jgi:hypothetical protein
MSSKSALEILKTHGLSRIAVQLCNNLNLERMEDIAKLSDKTIDALEISPVQKINLKELRDACAKGDPDLKTINREEATKRLKQLDEGYNELNKIEYEAVHYLTRHGLDDKDLAQRICKEIEITDEDEILLVSKSRIDRIEFISFEQKMWLWNLVCDAWKGWPVEKLPLTKLKKELDERDDDVEMERMELSQSQTRFDQKSNKLKITNLELQKNLDKRDDELRKLKEKLDERDDDVQRERRELSRMMKTLDETSKELEIMSVELQKTKIELQEEKKKNQELNTLLLEQNQRPEVTRRVYLQGRCWN